MRPPSLLASSATTQTLQPVIGQRLIPPLPDPESTDLATLELLARDYGEAHTTETGYPASRLAVAAFVALARRACLIAYPLGNGRWRSRPPAPGVTDALARLGQTLTPPTEDSDRLPPWASEPLTALPSGERGLSPLDGDPGVD